VKIVVDANIVFSGILNSNGKIGDLLINSRKMFLFIAPDFLRWEISLHHNKLVKISGLSLEQILEAEYQIYKSISFISEEQISKENWNFAHNLVFDIDPKDIVYIAFT
jgi:predicted nucleic acid-binding protein